VDHFFKDSFFAALHGMQMQYSNEKAVHLSVRPSVCLSNTWIVTEPKKDLFRFYTIQNIIPPSFLEEWLVGGGGNPFYVKFWVNCPPPLGFSDRNTADVMRL